MTAEIIDGRKIAAEIQGELKERIARLQGRGVSPKLTTILVGEDPASLSYLRGITRTCTDVGVATDAIKLPATTSLTETQRSTAFCCFCRYPDN
jgi:methylenetetrahydrofolate dehydrogenase (NADP+)/methenyltetrahydrofolate cyclohydrolase